MESARNDAAEIVPLRTDFDVRWRGYDREQVQYWVRQTEEDLTVLTADRDAAISARDDLAAELEATRAELRQLREKFDEVCRTPVSADGLSTRLRRQVELAQDEAAEITARARTAADHSWAAAQEAAQRLRGRHVALLRELDARRAELEREHRDLLERTRADVEAMTSRADAERAALDEQAARRRAAIQRDFDDDLRARRAAAQREVDDLRARARAEADAMIRAAEQEVRALNQARDEALAQLRTAHHLLSEALPLLADGPAAGASEDAVAVPAQLPPATASPAAALERADAPERADAAEPVGAVERADARERAGAAKQAGAREPAGAVERADAPEPAGAAA